MKKLTIIALLILSLLLYVGCSATSEQAQESNTDDAQTTTDVQEEQQAEEEQEEQVEEEPSYEVMETVDTSTMTIETGVGVGVSADYNADMWVFDGSGAVGAYHLYDSDFTDVNQLMNIAFVTPDSGIGGFALGSYTLIMEAQLKLVGSEVNVNEMKMLGETEIAYIENVTVMNDVMIDLLIEQGVLTEEQIELAGGREAIKAIPPTNQVMMTQVIDELAYTFVGTYYNEADKEVVIDALTLAMQTLKVTE